MDVLQCEYYDVATNNEVFKLEPIENKRKSTFNFVLLKNPLLQYVQTKGLAAACTKL